MTVADECGCEAAAGTLALVGNATVCYEMQPITVTATPDGNVVVPEDYVLTYVLTRGTELLIVQASETPSFEVNMFGSYTIHTLVYNPATFNFSEITIGQTNAFDVNEMLIQGGGATCGSLDIIGASIQVDDCTITMCDNPVVTNVTIIEATCGNENGSATVNVQGDLTDYNFTWSTEDGNSNAVGNVRTNLMAGAYTVTITLADNSDCETVQQIAIGNVDGPVLPTPVITSATCLAGNGAIDFSRASSNMTFTWSDDFTTRNTRENLTAGTYIVTLMDSNIPDCPQVMSIEVPSINTLVGSATINQQPTCGEADGSVTITVANGVGPFNFSWNDDRSATRMDLTSGTYEVVVVDEGTGCMTEVTFTLTDRVSEATVFIEGVTNISCPGETDGAVIFIVNETEGFASPATTQITDGNGNVFESGSLPAGEYCVVATDANGCVAGQGCFVIEEPTSINVEVALTNKTADTNGSIDLTVSGGTPNYSFDWSDLSGTTQPEDRADLTQGTYSVTVTDANGCSVVVENLFIADFEACEAVAGTAVATNNFNYMLR